MTTYYWDPEAGSDAADGLSFANRKRSITSFTAAMLAPGDVVRCIASPAPVSLGNATWTDNSRTVTLATAKNVLIDNCKTAWVPSTNVSVSNSTTNPRKTGTLVQTVTVGGTFVTGKLAHRALGAPLDLSAYQQISLWMRSSLTMGNNVFEVRFCSDTTGDVPVHTVTTDAGIGSTFRVFRFNNGAPLSSSIQSISLWAAVDPGAPTLSLDNIIACKGPADPDCLTHLSLIGKNTAGEPEWWPLMAIEGATLSLGGPGDAGVETVAATPQPYRGVSETVATSALQPLDGLNGQGANPALLAANRIVQDSGTEAAPLVFSGGWSRTDMATQTGASWMSGSYFAGSAFDLAARTWLRFERLSFAHFASRVFVASASTDNLEVQSEGMTACGTSGTAAWDLFSYAGAGASSADLGNFVACATAINTVAGGARQRLRARRVTASFVSGVIGAAGSAADEQRLYIDRIDNSKAYGLRTTSGGSHRPRLWLHGCVLENNTLGDVLIDEAASHPRLINCQMLTAGLAVVATTSATRNDGVRCQDYGGDPLDHRNFSRFYTLRTATDQRTTLSGVSWKLTMTATASAQINTLNPVDFVLAQYLAQAGRAITLKCWVRRDTLTMNAGLMVRADAGTGLAQDVRVLHTAGIDTWQQLEIALLPTRAGVIELVAIGWGAINTSAWWDDVSVI